MHARHGGRRGRPVWPPRVATACDHRVWPPRVAAAWPPRVTPARGRGRFSSTSRPLPDRYTCVIAVTWPLQVLVDFKAECKTVRLDKLFDPDGEDNLDKFGIFGRLRHDSWPADHSTKRDDWVAKDGGARLIEHCKALRYAAIADDCAWGFAFLIGAPRCLRAISARPPCNLRGALRAISVWPSV